MKRSGTYKLVRRIKDDQILDIPVEDIRRLDLSRFEILSTEPIRAIREKEEKIDSDFINQHAELN